jgi:hypothetical protein
MMADSIALEESSRKALSKGGTGSGIQGEFLPGLFRLTHQKVPLGRMKTWCLLDRVFGKGLVFGLKLVLTGRRCTPRPI